MLYPKHVVRCHHIKINGIQCGSPAMRGKRHCFFHHHTAKLNTFDLCQNPDINSSSIPLLEDAESIQIALMKVCNMLLRGLITHKDAGLLFYALQTASANLKRVAFEPALPTSVVIDERTVADRPVGATAWSSQENREYDDLEAVTKEPAPRDRKANNKQDQQDDEYDGEGRSLAEVLLKRLGLPEMEPEEAETADQAR